MDPLRNRSRGAEPAFSGVFSTTFLSIVLGVLVVTWGTRLVGPVGLGRSEASPRVPVAAGDLQPDELATIALFQEASRSVVSVESRARPWGLRGNAVEQASGSGFVWDEEGHVVTNLHVVRGGSEFQVRFHDGQAFAAEVLGYAPDYDLAVLRVAAPSEHFHSLPIGRSATLRVGQRSYAIGYPFGLEQTLTSGLVSGLDRQIQSMSELAIHGVIQTDAAINPGNSGGPLLDSSGHLIGINTAIKSATGANTGVGFAVPVDTINRIVPRILSEGVVERAGLGIIIGDDRLARDAGLRGAVVQSVAPDSPASAAGLRGLRLRGEEERIGDVIVAVDDVEIRRKADLYQALEAYRAGDVIRLRVQRGPGREDVETLRVRLAPLSGD